MHSESLAAPLVLAGERERATPRRRWWWRFARWLLTVLLVVGLVRTFLGEASLVPTASMEGTILVGDHLFLNKLPYAPEIPLLGVRLPRLRNARRGDIVAFRSPRHDGLTFLKRVVAVGGDRVEIRRDVLYVNGKAVAEPYVIHRKQGRARESMRPRSVAAGQLFVLGDNRDDSEDSRYWGSVPEENVIGEPLLVYWSYDAPSSAWLDTQPGHRLRLYSSIVANFLSHTRWSRTGTLVR